MRKRKITVRRYKDANRPNLKFVVRYRETGKPRRKFFDSEAAAKSFAAWLNAEMKRNGVEGAQFPLALRAMALECSAVLSEFGKTLRDATQFYVTHLRASAKSCTATQLVNELVAAKKADGASARHVSDLRSRLGIFAEKFGDQMVATITSTEIDDWLRLLPVKPITRNHYRRLIILAFNFAVRSGYATANPAVDAAKAKVVDKAPGILTVTETARLLEAASPDILPFVAVAAFAGLRRAELERLDWSEIDFESGLIEVKAEKSKTAQRRLVKMEPNLCEWLTPVRKLKGNVTPDNFRRQFDLARVIAGLGKNWKTNALRHSYASYHLAHFDNAALTALQLGHHDSRITFAHYRELVRPKEAEQYWDIRPAKPSKKIVQLVAR
jgi:integrase